MEAAQIIFAVLLPVSLMSVPIFAIWSNNRRRIAELKYGAQNRTADSAAHHELEERMRVLERIVTDKGFDVAARIEALRDTRRIEANEPRHDLERSM
jgi:hypothetical protein